MMQYVAVFLVMIGAGLVGATVNLAMRSDSERNLVSWRWNAVAGVGAALLMPLFLRTVSSSLLSDMLGDGRGPEDWLVFGAFCLLAAISARAFIQTLSDKVLKEARQASRQAAEAQRLAGEVATTARSAAAVARVARDAAGFGLQRAVASEGIDWPEVTPGATPDDPWKGQFGGISETAGRVLEAEIADSPGERGWRLIRLSVRATGQDRPLSGHVRFFLHPTFANHVVTVPVVAGLTELNLRAWGAFTVGAMADGGDTKMELDLADHPDADEPWRSR